MVSLQLCGHKTFNLPPMENEELDAVESIDPVCEVGVAGRSGDGTVL